MKNRFPQSILMLLIGSMCFTACDKDDDKEKTNTEKITLATWKYDKAEVDVDRNGTADSPVPDTYISACEKDNMITFKADNTGTIDEGPSKCNSSDPQSMPFLWTFKTNETIINFPAAIVTGVEGDVTIVSLTETVLVLKKEIDVPLILYPSGKVNIILTLKH